jgi:hypothetical protein
VATNDMLQSTNPRVYAVGDVALPAQFTHAAGGTVICVKGPCRSAPEHTAGLCLWEIMTQTRCRRGFWWRAVC